jgi:glycosyltransferase involved in cell wall biosynthesis
VDLPIEPIEQRYSIQWADWLAEAYEEGLSREAGSWSQIVGVTQVGAPALNPKLFLDPAATTAWKLSQGISLLARELPKLPDHSVIFFHDIWNPVVLQLHYYRIMAKKKWRIMGFMHAGSWDTTDLLAMADEKRALVPFEQALVRCADLTFYATKWAALRAVSTLGPPSWRVVGEPVHQVGFRPENWAARERAIVWPHRLARDKDIDRAVEIAKRCDARLIVTRSLGLSKESYYEVLRSTRVALSTAKHENFGISMLEAASAGCRCVVPDRLSYRELWPAANRYSNIGMDAAVGLCRKALNSSIPDLATVQLAQAFEPQKVARQWVDIMRAP